MELCFELPWASYQLRKIAGCACDGNAGNVFPAIQLQRKPLVSDPDMHHGTCVTHVPCCISGSPTRGDGENVPGIPGACATRNFTYLARGPWSPDRFQWTQCILKYMEGSGYFPAYDTSFFGDLQCCEKVFVSAVYWIVIFIANLYVFYHHTIVYLVIALCIQAP